MCFVRDVIKLVGLGFISSLGINIVDLPFVRVDEMMVCLYTTFEFIHKLNSQDTRERRPHR